MGRKTEQLTIGRRRIEVSNLDKVLYPGTKFTKGELIDYYIKVAKYILPHLKDRPVTLKRFPDGVFGEAFYEKDAPAFTPSWIKTTPVPRRETPGSDIQYIMITRATTQTGGLVQAGIDQGAKISRRAAALLRATACRTTEDE
jgi:bifunctional non-homologous end joining protein LigD